MFGVSLPNVGNLSAEQSKWLWIYLAGGISTWVFLQLFYVNVGRNYWQGFGPADPTNPMSQFSTGLQQVVFWPIALFSSLGATGILPPPS